MNFGAVIPAIRKAASDNTPAILTALGAAGTITTAYLAGKASFKASHVIRDAEDVEHEVMETKEKVNLVWKLYVPAVGTGVATVACIIFANRVSTKRAAGMAAAYSLSQDAMREYKTKVLEKVGDKKSKQIDDELTQDQVNRNPPGKHEIVIVNGDDILCYDKFTGRYFQSNPAKLEKAEIAVNQQIINDGYACLTDYYELVGLSATDHSDEIGWSNDGHLVLNYSPFFLEGDQKLCLGVSFQTSPIRGYYTFSR